VGGIYSLKDLSGDHVYILDAAPFETYIWVGKDSSEEDLQFAERTVDEMCESKSGWFMTDAAHQGEEGVGFLERFATDATAAKVRAHRVSGSNVAGIGWYCLFVCFCARMCACIVHVTQRGQIFLCLANHHIINRFANLWVNLEPQIYTNTRLSWA
jgi:hypothetical protein